MTRIRVAVALLAVALLVPTAFLVRRALAGVAAEEAARQRTVAERVFDEMELALTDLIAREDARPFADYDRTAEGAGAPSPLASPPELPFVVAYFQVDPDGSVRSPLASAGPSTPAGVAGRATAEALRAFQQARELVRPFFAGPARDEVARAPKSREHAEKDAKQAKRDLAGPAVRQPEASASLAKEQLAARKAPAKAAAEPPSAYDALQSLNRGAEQRAQRSRKLEVASLPAAAPPPPAAARAPVAEAEAQAARGDLAEGRVAQGTAVREEAVAAKVARGLADAAAPSPAQPSRAAATTAPAAEPARRVRIAVDPLTGRALDAGHLLLYRTALVGDRGYRQGLVIDLPALARWLDTRSIGEGGLPGAAAAFATPFGATSGAVPAERAVFRHRFAEPFDDLSVALALPPLEGGGEAATIRTLAALVAAATLAGLFALYRMVSVAVGYAERRSNFVAAVSHELKTPLTAIRMYGEMLRDGMVPTDAKRDEYYRTITSESERLSRLIDNVLEFARLEKGTREMRLSAGAIGPVVEELAELLRPHAARTGFELQVSLAPGLPAVRFERDALLQVLFNLVDNALKYARDASERVVRIECLPRDGGVELSVADRGPGVAARQLGRVFEPFHRGEDELTRTITGTGLGLALVKGLAERMGAAVSAGNGGAGGFEVRLAFPAATAASR